MIVSCGRGASTTADFFRFRPSAGWTKIMAGIEYRLGTPVNLWQPLHLFPFCSHLPLVLCAQECKKAPPACTTPLPTPARDAEPDYPSNTSRYVHCLPYPKYPLPPCERYGCHSLGNFMGSSDLDKKCDLELADAASMP